MKKLTIAFLVLSLSVMSFLAVAQKTEIITSDISNFWMAYDKIILSNDSLERIHLINQLYIDKASPGLKGMMRARNYEDYEFVEAIVNYQNYWNSIRGNESLVIRDQAKVDLYISQLRKIYPNLTPSKVYLTMGLFRSGGTYMDGNVLIGAEYFLANENSVIASLPEIVQNTIKQSFPYNLPLTCLHELIHTQQKPWENSTLMHMCVAEGVAEFISTLLSGEPLSPPIKYGKANKDMVVNQFMKEILRDDDVWNWLWSENTNELGIRDLGYYIGYEICETFYNNATDKTQAIKELIELDYESEEDFVQFLDGTGFLPLTWNEIGEQYEALRPHVLGVLEFKNGSNNVSSDLKVLTLEFSEAMSACCRNFDFDENREGEAVKFSSVIGWSEDKRHFSFKVQALKPNTEYHLIVSNFAKADGGNRSQPYTITFKTK